MKDIQIEQIRYELTWKIRHEVMYPDQPFDMIKLPNDPNGIHFGLYAGAWLTAVVSLFEHGNVYQFRKFATIVKEQGKGYGSQLLEYMIDFCKARGAEKLWCNARMSAAHFYSKFGLVPVGETFMQYDIEFVRMEVNFQTTK